MRDTIYFASDFHLGALAIPNDRNREQTIVSWLNSIADTASELFLMGDIFDYWFDYKHVVPKGRVRLLGALASLADQGVKIHFFTGNHDMWVFNYLKEELGATIYHHPEIIERFGKKLYIGHGDGLGPGDRRYKVIKAIFSNKMCQWLFSLIHPDLGVGLMRYVSKQSRLAERDAAINDIQKERLITYCEEQLQKDTIDYFIFGHRHIPVQHVLSNGKSTYFNLGEWWDKRSYVVMHQEGIQLNYYHEK